MSKNGRGHFPQLALPQLALPQLALAPTADLAKTVKVKSEHSENLAKVLGGAKNGKIILMFPNNFSKPSEINFFRFDFY